MPRFLNGVSMRFLTCVLLLGLAAPLRAQEPGQYNENWYKEPYQLDVVIYAEPHPMLTKLFVEQFRKNLHDCLQRDLGETTKVSAVVYHEEAGTNNNRSLQMMEAVLKNDWSILENAGTVRNQIGGPKVHLVRVQYKDGEYVVQSRQVDGDTGVVSPLRVSRTTDRQFVSRLACMQVAQDFGQTGEIYETTNQTVRVHMRAAGRGVPQTVRMNQGEVMAVAVVRRTTNGYAAYRLPETLAYITNVNADRGEVTARVYSRDKDVLRKDSQTVGFRVLKVGTLRTPLHLRVVDKENNPISGYSVMLYPGGYENPSVESLGTTDAQGRVSTKDPVSNVAFVQVNIAGVGKANAPVPLIDDQPIVITINNNDVARRLDDTRFVHGKWFKRYSDLVDDWEITVRIAAKQTEEGKVKESRELRRKLAVRMKEQLGDLEKLEEEVKSTAGDLSANLAKSMVEQVVNGNTRVREGSAELEQTVKLEENPTPAMIEYMKGKNAEDALDFDGALEHYNKSISLDKNQPKLVTKTKGLARAWRMQSGDKVHSEARNFAIKIWANKEKKLTWEEVGKELGNAYRYLDDLEPRGDYLTARILRTGNLQNLRTLLNARDTLGNSEEMQEKQALIEKFKKDLTDFNKKCEDFETKTINDLNKE